MAGRELRRIFTVIWFQREGKVQSYRFHRDELELRYSTLTNLGWEEIPDPFRKGAPLGGYPYEGSTADNTNRRRGDRPSDNSEGRRFLPRKIYGDDSAFPGGGTEITPRTESLLKSIGIERIVR